MPSSESFISSYPRERIIEIIEFLKSRESGYLTGLMSELNIPLRLILEIVDQWSLFEKDSMIALDSTASKFLVLPENISHDDLIKKYTRLDDFQVFFYKDRLFKENELLKYTRENSEELNNIIKIITEQRRESQNLKEILSRFEKTLVNTIRDIPESEEKTKLLNIDKRIKFLYMKGYPIHLDEISKDENLDTSCLEGILNYYLNQNIFHGYLINQVFYPEIYLDLVGNYLRSHSAGKIKDITEELNIPHEIFIQAIENLIKYQTNSDTLFTILHGDEDTKNGKYQLVKDDDIEKIIQQLNSISGLDYKRYIQGLTAFTWVKLLNKLKKPYFFYKNHFYLTKGLIKYIKRNQEEINDVMNTIRLQLVFQKIPIDEQLKIILDFEKAIISTIQKQVPNMELPKLFEIQKDELLNLKDYSDAIELPYYCQIDSAMITVGNIVFCCSDCERKICPTCVNAMMEVGVVRCVHCGGTLIKKPTIQIELSVENIQNMSNERFYDFITDLFITQGYLLKTIETIDSTKMNIIILKNNSNTGIQFNRPKENIEINEKNIKKLLTNEFFKDCNNLKVITTSFFTTKAIEFAENKNIEIWDRKDLENYLNQYREYLLHEA